MAKFQEADTQILGISVDSPPALAKFAKEIGVSFPLLSDLSHKVSKEYGVLDETRGFARRTTFVVDKHGKIRGIEQGQAALDPAGAQKTCALINK
ncbi:MAG: peroxiredoxin family protein [Acidobacteria bacterium]|nr:peroxiredoxin family protein [Acidobacteriota bacterium]MBI3655862.1 peroxiredoxin family protein [Acidobacteriota bacterium]